MSLQLRIIAHSKGEGGPGVKYRSPRSLTDSLQHAPRTHLVVALDGFHGVLVHVPVPDGRRGRPLGGAARPSSRGRRGAEPRGLPRDGLEVTSVLVPGGPGEAIRKEAGLRSDSARFGSGAKRAEDEARLRRVMARPPLPARAVRPTRWM